jgi:iron complex transport system permease protein
MAISNAPHTISEIEAPRRPRDWSATMIRAAGLIAGLAIVAVVAVLSLRFGSLSLSTRDAWDALFNYNPDDYEQVIVRSLRLPRTVIAICVGGALGVAGTVMQGVTRNPLADPSILGVSQGASLGVAIAFTYLGLTSPGEYIWVAFAGAMLAAVLVFAVGTAGKGGAGPIKLALAGVVVSALLGAWTSTLLLMREETMDAMRFWLAGSVAGRGLDVLRVVSPFLVAGVLACLLLGHQLNVLGMGDDNARALGMRTGRVRVLASIFVIFITGAAVAVAGPIGFVGLATPHIARAIAGADYRWILPYALVLGAILLPAADVIGRLVARPAELQVGIVTALVGAPFLIYLVRVTRLGS